MASFASFTTMGGACKLPGPIFEVANRCFMQTKSTNYSVALAQSTSPVTKPWAKVFHLVYTTPTNYLSTIETSRAPRKLIFGMQFYFNHTALEDLARQFGKLVLYIAYTRKQFC